jgi:hypothetical protein
MTRETNPVSPAMYKVTTRLNASQSVPFNASSLIPLWGISVLPNPKHSLPLADLGVDPQVTQMLP